MNATFRPFIPYLAATVVSIVLILSSRHPGVGYIRAAMGDLVGIMGSPVASVVHLPRIWRENRALRTKLTAVGLELSRRRELAAEAEALRRMLNFKGSQPFRLIAAEVVGLNPDPGVRSILIDKGAQDGVERLQPVVTPDGLVGRVYRAGPSTSAVQLLTDPNLGVAARLTRNRESGIVHSAGGTKLRLDGVPSTAEVMVGDTVVTSGLGGIFPEGVIIGVVSRVSPQSEQWLLDILLSPVVKFSRLEQVFLVVGAPGGN